MVYACDHRPWKSYFLTFCSQTDSLARVRLHSSFSFIIPQALCLVHCAWRVVPFGLRAPDNSTALSFMTLLCGVKVMSLGLVWQGDFKFTQCQLYSLAKKGKIFLPVHYFCCERWGLNPTWTLEQHCCPIVRPETIQFRAASSLFSKAAVNSENKVCCWGIAWPPPSPE